MVKTLLILSLFLSGCSTMEVSTDTLLVADWLQSYEIASDPERTDGNIFIGEHGSTGRVNTYFTSCIVANHLVHRYLPEKYLPFYQTGLIAVQVYAVSHNYQVGVRVRF